MSHAISSMTTVLTRYVEVATRGVIIFHLEEWDDDRSLRCVYVNPAAERIAGIAAAQQIGHLIDDIVPGLRRTGLVAAYADVIRKNSVRSFGDTQYGDERVPHGIYSVSANPLGDQCVAVVLENVTERRRAEAARAEMEQRFTDLFQHSVDAILITEDSAVIASNPAACALLGYGEAELRGLRRQQIVACDDAEVRRMMRSLEETGHAFGELVLQRKDGSMFPAEISAYQYPNGTSCRNSISIRDITERRAVDRLKSEFVSTVSHELRTPLTSIHGALGLLGSGVLGSMGDKAQRMLEIALANTQRLVRLINDILDLERMESGTITIARTETDAYSLMCKAAEGVQALADESEITIEVEKVHATLHVDADRILQTLTNLLSNAIKFSPRETTVIVSGSVENGRFTMRVADRGRGIPDGKRDAIFERFKQVDASDSRAKGGTGLGLAICKSIVAAHGGRIWVENNDHCGSVFLFTVPLSHVPASEPMPDAPDATAILIVEDDLDLARVVMAALQTHGIHAVHAANGNDAIALCNAHEPLLIILDIALPDIDGFAVVDELRHHASLRGTPLLVYSALDVAPSDRERLTLGPTEFLTKSRVSMEELETAVERLLGVMSSASC